MSDTRNLKELREKYAELFKLVNHLEPVLVYQMGKVASHAILSSLNKAGFGNVFHIHRINEENIREVVKKFGSIKIKVPKTDLEGLFVHKHKLYENSRIITLVRDPVDRNMSAFFQNFKEFTGYDFKDNKWDIDEVSNLFLKNYEHTIPLNWFNDEFEKTTGINIYDFSFNKERGWDIISNGGSRILIIKVEIDDEEKSRALSEFLDQENIEIIRSNSSKIKEYNELYREFKTNISLPEHYLHEMYNSKFVEHFYSEEEVERFYNKWRFPGREFEPPEKKQTYDLSNDYKNEQSSRQLVKEANVTDYTSNGEEEMLIELKGEIEILKEKISKLENMFLAVYDVFQDVYDNQDN